MYDYSVEELFLFLFTDNEQLSEFMRSARRSDLQFAAWSPAAGSGRRKRVTTYTVELTNPIGPKATNVTEQQVLREVGRDAVDGYTVTKDAVNAGVPYADSFSVLCTYCLTRETERTARLRVHGQVLYKKSLLGVFKSECPAGAAWDRVQA